MSNTTKITGKSLQIKGLDADWTIPGDLASFIKTGLKIKSIKFRGSNVNDILVIKAGHATQLTAAAAIATTLTAPEIMYAKITEDTDQRIEYFNKGQTLWPFIDISDCTFTTAATCRVDIELA